MSIWEEWGQKLTQGSQDVLQKARDISDVVTMNSDISDSRRKIRDLYAELGELLVRDAFADMTAADIRDMIGDESADADCRAITLKEWKEIFSKVMYIRSEEEVIAINEKKIEGLKSSRICPNCGCRVTKSMSFCPECGSRLAEAAGQKEAVQPEAVASEAVRSEAVRPEAVQSEAVASEAVQSEAVASEAVWSEAAAQGETVNKEAVQKEAVQKEAANKEAAQKADGQTAPDSAENKEKKSEE